MPFIKLTPFGVLNLVAEERFGEFGFATLEIDDMDRVIDVKRADALAASETADFGVKTMSEDVMHRFFNAHPDLIRPEYRKLVGLTHDAAVHGLAMHGLALEATDESYKVRWHSAGGSVVGSVNFRARSDADATKQVARLARQLGLTRSLYTLYCGNRCVNEDGPTKTMKIKPSSVATFLGEATSPEANVTVSVTGTPATVQRAIKQLAKKPGRRLGAPPSMPTPHDKAKVVDTAADVVESLIA